MVSILIFIVVIMAFAVMASFRLDKTFEEALPVSCMGIIVLLFLFGMINLLHFGAIVVGICSLGLYLYTGFYLYKNHSTGTLKKGIWNLITPGFFVFAVMAILLAYWNKGRLAIHTDEFSHWLDTVVIMSRIDAFGTAEGSTAVFPSYPPAMSLFQYLLEKINIFFSGEFSEWKTYYAYQLFAVVMMLPFLKSKGQKIPKKIVGLLLWMVALIAPLYFFSEAYSSLYIDPILGLLGGCGFAYIALSSQKDWLYHLHIALMCAVLTITKDVGIYIALFIAIYYFIDNCQSKEKSVKHLAIGLAPMISLLLAKILWKIELAVTNTAQKFSAPFDVSGTIATIRGEGSEYYTAVYDNFKAAITYRYIYYERLGFNYCAIMALMTIGFIYFSHRLHKKERANKASAVAGAIIPSIAIIFYILSMFPLYISRFVEEEALNLASFDRYVGIMFLMGFLALLWLFRDVLMEHADNPFIIVVSILVVLSAVHSQKLLINDYTSRDSVRASQEYRQAVDILSDTINASTDEDASILLVGRDEDAIYHPILETISKPRSFTYSDVYFSGEVSEDTISVDELKDIFKSDYDYVAIYTTTDNLLTNYTDIFDNKDDIHNLSLYRVDKTTGMLSLIQ